MARYDLKQELNKTPAEIICDLCRQHRKLNAGDKPEIIFLEYHLYERMRKDESLNLLCSSTRPMVVSELAQTVFPDRALVCFFSQGASSILDAKVTL